MEAASYGGCVLWRLRLMEAASLQGMKMLHAGGEVARRGAARPRGRRRPGAAGITAVGPARTAAHAQRRTTSAAS
jgi:hypothetical protein